MPPLDAVVHLLACSKSGLGVREIARQLGVSASTAHRRVQQLRKNGWIASVTDLHERYSYAYPDYEERLTLEPDRPSLSQYLSWMWIEYGTQSEAYWRFIDEVRTGPHPHGPYTSHLPAPKAAWPIADAVEPLVADGLGVSSAVYRQHFSRFWRLNGWVGSMEGSFQALYRATHQERCRDFIHLLIHLGEDLPRVPESPSVEDCRPQLAELAAAANQAAVVYDRYAQRVFTASVIASSRSQAVERLAGSVIRDTLPGFTDYYGSTAFDRLQIVEQIRRLDDEFDGGDQYGSSLYSHGGNVSRGGVGHGGDALLAYQMHKNALQMITIRNEILAVPTMLDLINRAGQKSAFQAVIEDELLAVDLKNSNARTSFPNRFFEDDGSYSEASEEITVALEDLIPGDLVVRGNGRPFLTPLRVEEIPKKGEVLLADEKRVVSVRLPHLTRRAIELTVQRGRP